MTIETAMATDKFDAYGDVLPDARREATTASGIVNRVGQAVFWLIVVVIVSARIIWYPAAPTFQVGSGVPQVLATAVPASPVR